LKKQNMAQGPRHTAQGVDLFFHVLLSFKFQALPEETMTNANPERPVCIIIAGPNGAGKTTFAREYLPNCPVTLLCQ
jgi:signal recognition particle GTPase